jgi:pyruvate ferredoxin oxidoreductase gamma subunit
MTLSLETNFVGGEMVELRFHGRGGQGSVTSAELLALAAIAQGKFAQSFPKFGPERRGAPVIAYARISDQQIRDRTEVQNPDVVIVLDPSLLSIVNTSKGMPEDGIQIVNTTHSAEHLRKEFGLKGKLVTLNANKIASEEIGRVITNTTIIEQLKVRFGRIAEGNIKAFKRAHDECVCEK